MYHYIGKHTSRQYLSVLHFFTVHGWLKHFTWLAENFFWDTSFLRHFFVPFFTVFKTLF